MFLTTGFSVFLLAIGAIVGIFLGGLVGTLAGTCAAIFLRTGFRGLLWDAVFGVIGFWSAFIACVLIPIGPNTIQYTLPEGVVVTSTMNTYQHPYELALAVSALLSITREIFGARRRRNIRSSRAT